MKIGILGGSFDPIHRGHLNMAEKALAEYGLDQVWLIPAGHSPNKDEDRMTPGELRLEMTAAAIGAGLHASQVRGESSIEITTSTDSGLHASQVRGESSIEITTSTDSGLHASQVWGESGIEMTTSTDSGLPVKEMPGEDGNGNNARPDDAVRLAQGTIRPEFWVSSIEVDSPETSYTYKTLEKLHKLYPRHRFYFIMGADSLDYFDRWVKPDQICRLAVILVVNRDQFSDKQLQDKILKINAVFPADIRIVHCPKMDISSTKIRRQIREGIYDETELTPEVIDFIRSNHIYN